MISLQRELDAVRTAANDAKRIAAEDARTHKEASGDLSGNCVRRVSADAS